MCYIACNTLTAAASTGTVLSTTTTQRLLATLESAASSSLKTSGNVAPAALPIVSFECKSK